ncbi:hypothetical protein [Ovoidimarina sediminis]|uniref:hypothetical protein n=1 Tax=Ovoidimarina sediminis TaxID=3079856 RepID=UPI00290E7921|nr:hypothetical protein [Rhodophyticola sp. MJ-SS7]MDU8941880.1 hypothetical protein [Rhodophyticola sp. MJ-SS7]
MTPPQRTPASTRHHIGAGLLTALLSLLYVFGSFRLAPWGCDVSAWLCLMPISVLYVSPPAALLLPLAVMANRRRQRPFPDGLLPLMIATGLVAQAAISGTSLWLSAPHMRHIFVYDVLIFPYGFLAGALAAGVFRLSLSALARLWRTG